MMKRKAIVLLSGGIDSATTLFMAKDKDYECYPLIFDYKQRHRRELDSARKISNAAGFKYKILNITLPWKGSSLIDKRESLPKARSIREIKRGVPSSYVPARNAIFLSFAASFAEAIGAEKVFIGANSVDFSGYPDCRPAFIKAFDGLIREGTKAGLEGRRISVEAPLLLKTKAQIIKEGRRLDVPYKYTWSCYDGKETPCGTCDSCILRRKGFEEAGIEDPLMKYGKEK